MEVLAVWKTDKEDDEHRGQQKETGSTRATVVLLRRPREAKRDLPHLCFNALSTTR